MERCVRDVETALDGLLPPVAGPRGRVIDAMRYACLGGGKRLRPLLLLSTAALFDAPAKSALRAAAAIEMVHCYSLIHDDLPAMDDAELRRGRAAVHRQFDEATAILAGDGLLSLAFSVLADPATDTDPAVRAELVGGLARASGPEGMVGGQMIDLSAERWSLDLTGITELQRLKTGAMIACACASGAILGRAGKEDRATLAGYADDLGLAFQIVDDLLDAEASTEALGKPAGRDSAAGKATFVGQLGPAGARDRAAALVDDAVGRLQRFGNGAETLCQIARFVLERGH
ncbi:MAG: polyprenyl synthetase family protein [Inquilinus sp.]|nr:polyprenyl synthetase family protein [Inquilinus sp.]